jgi:hypothetical protein
VIEIKQAELKQTVVKGIGADQLPKNARDNCLHAQGDHEEVSHSRGQQEAVQTIRLPQAGVIEIEAAPFQIREEGFGGEAQGIEAFGCGGTWAIGHEEPMLLAGLTLTTANFRMYNTQQFISVGEPHD